MPHLQTGPPSAFALKVRPYFIAMLAVQLLLCAGRLFISDFWGAMLMVLVTLVGSFVVSAETGVDITYCAYYGIMVFVCGVFDVILCVERAARSPHPVFARKAPVMYNVASAIYLASPLIEFLSAYITYLLFKDAEEWEEEEDAILPTATSYGTIRAGANSDRANSDRRPPEPSNVPRRPPAAAFTPFQGFGVKLPPSCPGSPPEAGKPPA